MGLVDLRTDLKSLKFGKDIVGGGNSNQPYVVKDIPSSFQDVGRTGGPDFLLRGGTLFPRAVANDVSRMTQMLFDFRTPNGPLFIAKQNVLSLSNVSTAAGPYKKVNQKEEDKKTPKTGKSTTTAIGNFIRNNLALNQGIYTPLSTIISAAGTGLGIHVNKQGLNPFNPFVGATPDNISTKPPGLTIPTYIQIVAGKGTDGTKSRLTGFLPKVNARTGADNNLYKYTGGPGALLGVGVTAINMLNDQRTGINNPNTLKIARSAEKYKGAEVNEAFGLLSFNLPHLTYTPSPINILPTKDDIISKNDLYYRTGASAAYVHNNAPIYSYVLKLGFNADGVSNVYSIYDNNDNKFSLATKISNTAFKSGIGEINAISTWTHKELTDQPKNTGIALENFETKIPEVNKNDQIPVSPSYINYNIEKRVNLGNPGKRGNIKSYTIGKLFGNETKASPLDKITALPLYNSSAVIQNSIKDDLVKFRIGIINNDDPNNKTYIHFRAFIDSFSDAYTADWMSQKFMGRAENFYKYQGFDRAISLSWTVAAQSKQELIPMYQKLNYLASSLAPDYSDVGYMQGNLITLTVGGWLYEQTGIVTGMTLDVPDDSPWDISIKDSGEQLPDGTMESLSDSSVKELPMIIKVSGFSFIPIHNFVPRIQQNKYEKSTYQKADANYIETYGKERYVALNNGSNNNYDAGKGQNYVPQKTTKTS